MSLTTDTYLKNFAKMKGIPLLGVIYKDELDTLISYALSASSRRTGFGVIINMSDSEDSNGTHWTALWVAGRRVGRKEKSPCVHMDSFGVAPAGQIVNFCKSLGRQMMYSKRQIQNIRSGYCGQYCLIFLRFMSLGRAKKSTFSRMAEFIRLFDDDVTRNKKILLELMERYF